VLLTSSRQYAKKNRKKNRGLEGLAATWPNIPSKVRLFLIGLGGGEGKGDLLFRTEEDNSRKGRRTVASLILAILEKIHLFTGPMRGLVGNKTNEVWRRKRFGEHEKRHAERSKGPGETYIGGAALHIADATFPSEE